MAKIAKRHATPNSLLNQMPPIDRLVNYAWYPGTVQLRKTSCASDDFQYVKFHDHRRVCISIYLWFLSMNLMHLLYAWSLLSFKCSCTHHDVTSLPTKERNVKKTRTIRQPPTHAHMHPRYIYYTVVLPDCLVLNCHGRAKLQECGTGLLSQQSLNSLHFKWHMVMPFIIKTQVVLFHLFIQARLFLPFHFHACSNWFNFWNCPYKIG